MTFANPVLLAGLLLVPLVVLALVLARRRRARYAVRYPALDVLAGVVARTHRWRRHLPAALFLLALTVLLLGAARPMARVPVPRDQATVLLVVDVSGSMNADDVDPTRLDAARAAAGRFLDRLPDRFQVGLVTFSSDAQTLVQPTTDRQAVRLALETLQANGGTAMGDGLARALDSIETLRQAGGGEQPGAAPPPGTARDGPPAVALLLSDGANSAGGDPLVQADRARALGVPVYTIALGTRDGVLRTPDPFGGVSSRPVPPDEQTLARIAETSGGRAFLAASSRNLAAVYDSLGSRIGYRVEEHEVTVAFAVAALVLLGAAGLLWTRSTARLP
ncbi:MAG TPA: VWA domain-containing protein [Actinomycetes bacterium]|jgi:Ca-activated chloride channel family protein|nr:VWA domain-containing protein [Actinomycetes bacterium]